MPCSKAGGRLFCNFESREKEAPGFRKQREDATIDNDMQERWDLTETLLATMFANISFLLKTPNGKRSQHY